MASTMHRLQTALLLLLVACKISLTPTIVDTILHLTSLLLPPRPCCCYCCSSSSTLHLIPPPPISHLLPSTILQLQPGHLTEDELVQTAFLLLVAGNATVASMINLGVVTLLQHPDQLKMLQEDPSLWPGAVDELCRYHTASAYALRRVAVEDVKMDGQVRGPRGVERGGAEGNVCVGGGASTGVEVEAEHMGGEMGAGTRGGGGD